MLAAGGGMWTVGPNDPLELPFSVESAAALSAMPDAGHRFAGWTGPCEGSGPVCLLDKGAAKPVTADATVRALFELAALTLTVAAGAGGSVAVDVDGAAVGTVGPDFREGFGLGVGSTATLTAMPDAGWAFAGWTLSGDRAPACADGGAASRCVLAAGSVAAGAGVAAMFEAAATTLTVAAGTGGSVEVDVDGAAATRTVAAGGSTAVGFSAERAATLLAVPDAGWAFAGWTLSGDRAPACAGAEGANPCRLAAGSVTADAEAAAMFEAAALTLTVAAGAGGSVEVDVDGAAATRTVAAGGSTAVGFSAERAATLSAMPAPGYAFAGWTLSGDPAPACAGGLAARACRLAAASVTAAARAHAAFEAAATTLTVAAGAGGRVLAAGGGMWTVGPNDPLELPFSVESAAALSAMPDAGHRFAGWTGPCEGSGPVCLLDKGAAKPVTADATVRALFELAALTLTVAAGAGGSVAVDVDGAAVGTVGPDFREGFGLGVGSTATLTAMPDAGWAFAGWTLSGDRAPACADGGAASRCVLAAGSVAAGAGVAAMFEAAATTLTVAAGTGGSVEVDVDGAAATRTVAAGGSTAVGFSAERAATLLAVPDAGWAFAGWTLSGDRAPACAGAEGANPCRLAAGSVTADAEAAAMFEAAALTLTVAAGAGGSVEVDVDGAAATRTVAAGGSTAVGFSAERAATLSAMPAPGYAFAGWTLSGDPAPACAGGLAARACRLAAASVTAAARAHAAFEAAATTLTVAAGAGGRVLAAGGGMWTVGPNDPLELPFSVESAAALSAMPDAGHRFAGWTGPCEGSGPVCLLDKGAAKPVTADATVRALFELAALTLTVAAGAGGSVAVDVDGAAVGTVGPDFREGFGLGVGSTATLTAMPDAGWAFAGWTLSGDRAPACADGGAASRCVLAAGSVAAGAGVAAMFEAAATTLTVAAGTGGSVEVDVDGAAATRTVAAGGSTAVGFSAERAATLLAVPDAGWAFAGWTLSGDRAPACAGAEGANPCRLAAGSVTADAEAAAMFEAAALTLTVAAGAGGSVEVDVDGAAATRTVAAGGSTAVGFSAERAATLSAMPAPGYAFAGWTLSGDPAPACAGGRPRAPAGWRPPRSPPPRGRTPPSRPPPPR